MKIKADFGTIETWINKNGLITIKPNSYVFVLVDVGIKFI